MIDTSALVAILRMEPEAAAFIRLIIEEPLRKMSAMSVLEASLVLSAASDPAGLFEPLDSFIAAAGIGIVPFDEEQMFHARQAFARFGKGRHRASLNFGDCASYALARHYDCPLLYKGRDFAETDIASAAAS